MCNFHTFLNFTQAACEYHINNSSNNNSYSKLISHQKQHRYSVIYSLCTCPKHYTILHFFQSSLSRLMDVGPLLVQPCTCVNCQPRRNLHKIGKDRREREREREREMKLKHQSFTSAFINSSKYKDTLYLPTIDCCSPQLRVLGCQFWSVQWQPQTFMLKPEKKEG